MVKKILLISLIGFGIFLRIYRIEEVPHGLFLDEIGFAINAKTIADWGTDEYAKPWPFGFESFFDFKNPVYIYSTALVYKLLGPSVLTVRLLSLFSGIGSIFLVGYLAKLLFPKHKELSWYSMVALSLNLYHIHFSRIVYENSVVIAFILVLYISIAHIVHYGNFVWIYAGMLAIISASWLYSAGLFITTTFVVGVVTLIFMVKKKNNDRSKKLWAGLFLCLTVVIAYVPFFFDTSMNARPFDYVLTSGGRTFSEKLVTKIITLVSSYIRVFNFEYLFSKGDTYAFRHGTGGESGIFLPIFIIPFILGVIVCIRGFTWKKISHQLFALFTIIIGLPSALTSWFPYGSRILPMMVPLSFVVAFGIEWILMFLKTLRFRFRIGIMATVGFIFIYELGWFWHIYFVHFPVKSAQEFVGPANEIAFHVRDALKEDSALPVYFLGGRSCVPWAQEILKLWYFAGLDNSEMIGWNKVYRRMRYNSDNSFAAFDNIPYPRAQIGSILLNATVADTVNAPQGALIVRCGIHLKDINREKEKVEKLLFLSPSNLTEPVYVITRKR